MSTASLRVTLMLHETNFSPNKGTSCGVLIHEVQICLMLRETAVTSNSAGETGVMNLREAGSGV